MSMKKGVSRGIFSNEAGLGTGSIAHACADTRKPVKQGFFKRQAESPAYEGNPGNNNGIIDYGIDLSGCSEQDLIFWDMVTDILDQDTSAIHRAAREKVLTM